MWQFNRKVYPDYKPTQERQNDGNNTFSAVDYEYYMDFMIDYQDYSLCTTCSNDENTRLSERQDWNSN